MFNVSASKVALLQGQDSFRGLVHDVRIRCFHGVDAREQLAKLNQPGLSCADSPFGPAPNGPSVAATRSRL